MNAGVGRRPQAAGADGRLRWLLLVLLLLSLSGIAVGSQARAQSEPDSWTAPVNLSHSGAASDPVLLAQPDGSLLAFWWDRFDGLTLSASAGMTTTQWGEPQRVPIQVPRPSDGGVSGTVELVSIANMPRLIADTSGTVHAFWLADAEFGRLAQPLLHARLAPGAAAWSTPQTLADSAIGFDVIAGKTGTLHLAYVTAVEETGAEAGLYYRRSVDEGRTWRRATSLDRSRYLRLLSPATAYVRLAADDRNLYVTWDDPHEDQSLFVVSADEGTTWQSPRLIGDAEKGSRRVRIVPVIQGETLLLWEAGAAETCSLYQASVDDVLAGRAITGQRVLRGLASCSMEFKFLSLGNGHILLLVGVGTNALTLAAWDGEQWSETKQLGFGFQDAESGRELSLTTLQPELLGLRVEGRQGPAEQTLAVSGADQDGDVWATGSQVSALEFAFAPPPPWSQVVSLTESVGPLGEPAITVDDRGQAHVLWAEPAATTGTGAVLQYTGQVHSKGPQVEGEGSLAPDEVRWMAARTVLQLPKGTSGQPSMTSLRDRLHAVWSDASSSSVFYSSSFAPDAYLAGAWSEPVPLSSGQAMGSEPRIAAGKEGDLHVVYAVPINEGRGIYHTRSDDGGQTWLPAKQVFDAAAMGWAMVGSPCLAIDGRGTVHVVWARTAPGMGESSAAIYYANSSDGGVTWTKPLQVVEGSLGRPLLATVNNQVHLLWSETGGDVTWWHRWFEDVGGAWTQPSQVGGFTDVSTPVTLLGDGGAGLHLVGLGYEDDETPVLLYSTWAGSRWSKVEQTRLPLASVERGVTAALSSGDGNLSAIILGRPRGQSEAQAAELWYTARGVVVGSVTPEPTEAPSPSSLPSPAPTATLPALPSPTSPAAPSLQPGVDGSQGDAVPLLAAGGLASLLVLGILIGRFIWTGRR